MVKKNTAEKIDPFASKEGEVDITLPDGSKFDKSKKYNGTVLKTFDGVPIGTKCSIEAMFSGELIMYVKLNNKFLFKYGKQDVDFKFTK